MISVRQFDDFFYVTAGKPDFERKLMVWVSHTHVFHLIPHMWCYPCTYCRCQARSPPRLLCLCERGNSGKLDFEKKLRLWVRHVCFMLSHICDATLVLVAGVKPGHPHDFCASVSVAAAGNSILRRNWGLGWPGAEADATATIGGAGGMALHVQRRQDPAEEATLTMPEMLSSFGSEFWMKNQLFRVTFVGFASLHIFICNKYFKILYQLLHCKYLHLRKLTVTITGFFCNSYRSLC